MLNKLKVSRTAFVMLLAIFPIAIVAKFYEYHYMGSNAFILINYVLRGIYNGILTGRNSLDFPIKILSVFKFLNLNTPRSSGIFCAVIMNILCFLIFLFYKKRYTIDEYVFIYLTMFVLNLMVFDFNKDIIQFCIILILYKLLSIERFDNIQKILVCSGVLLFESIFFRSYYILAGGLTPMIFVMLSGITPQTNKKNIALRILCIVIFFFVVIYAMKFISYEAYDELVTRRDNIERLKANTQITNLFKGTSYATFCMNYFVNLIRCLFPLEIFTKGIQFVIFTIYELYISLHIILSLRHITKENIVKISFILAYCMMLAASEADFGTFVRHQSVMAIFYLYMITQNNSGRKTLCLTRQYSEEDIIPSVAVSSDNGIKRYKL